MSGELAGAVASIRLMWDIVQANKGLTDYNKMVAALSEVNSELISSQAATIASQKGEMALAERVRELEQKIVALEDWDREEKRYALTNIAPSIPARVLKSGMEQGEHPHPLCATCFEGRKKVFLALGSPQHGTVWHCSTCNSTFHRAVTRPPRLPDTNDDAQPGDGRVKY